MGYRRLFVLIGALVLVEVMFYSVLAPLLPYYARHLGVSKPEAGVLSASYAVGTIVFSVPSGFLVARIGARRTVIAGTALLAASSVAFGFIHAVVALDAARCIQGVGGAFVWTGGLAWLVASAPSEQRGQTVGTVLGVGIGGALLGPLLGAAATVAGPELVFSLVAAAIAALGCFVVATEGGPPGRANTFRELVAAIGIDPRIWAGFWFTALPSLVFGVLEVLAPLRMGALGAGAGAIGITFLVAAAIEARLSPVWGRLSDRHGPTPVARAGLAAAAAMAALVWAPGAIGWMAVAVVAACVSFGIPWVPASSLLSAGAEQHGLDQGVAFALWSFAWGAGQAIGSMGGAAVAEATTDAVPYLALAAACVVTLLAIRRPIPETLRA